MKFAEDILNEKDQPMITIPQDATLLEALQVMVENSIGAIVVMEGENVVGIYSERDFLRETVKERINPKTEIIKDHMITKLFSAPYNDPIYLLMDKILGRRIRHIFIEKEGKHIGILSAHDIIKACLNERTKEMESMSWDYYENWCWKPKKR
jgi:CBS domain-containing protein